MSMNNIYLISKTLSLIEIKAYFISVKEFLIGFILFEVTNIKPVLVKLKSVLGSQGGFLLLLSRSMLVKTL